MINSSLRLISSALSISCIILFIPSVFTLWANSLSNTFDDKINWAIYCGALLPSSNMHLAEFWRVFTAPLLHDHISHLFSNGLLIFLALVIAGQYMTLKIDFRSILTLMKRIYLWGVIVASLRFFWGVEAYSMGLSGAALAMLTHHIYQMSTFSDIKHTLHRGLIFLSPWALAIIDMSKSVDVTSHLFGVAIGAIWSCCDLMVRDQEKL